jgi:predicted nucleic acid-binding protein
MAQLLMKTMNTLPLLTRRDRCFAIGRAAQRLTPEQAAEAWNRLGRKLEEMGELDVPKFNDLLIAIEVARRVTRTLAIRRKQ